MRRLRPAYTEDELKEIYSVPHSHAEFPDHVLRVDHTLQLAASLLTTYDHSGADLSCGDGYILDQLPLETKYYGDYQPGRSYTGPIERTIHEIPPVDVFVLCETLEHLDDPWLVLRAIRCKAQKLLLSTPFGEHTDENPEHYWGWDDNDIKSMLLSCGWSPELYAHTKPSYGYEFQIWGCY